VTFDLNGVKGEKGEGVKQSKRESSVPRDKMQDSREREVNEEDGKEVEREERMSSSVSSSNSIREDGFEDGSLTKSESELSVSATSE
jgi:hypothetical protein